MELSDQIAEIVSGRATVRMIVVVAIAMLLGGIVAWARHKGVS